MLNYAIDNLSKQLVLIILVGLFAFDCIPDILFENRTLSGSGYSIFHFVCIYCLARYLGKYDFKLKYPFLWYAVPVSIMIIAILIGYYVFKERIYWYLLGYNNPLVILASIGFFYTFKSISINSQFINKVAPLSFGVYLIHNHSLIFDKCIKPVVVYLSQFYSNTLLSRVSTLILFCIFIFVSCLLIDKLRQLICTPLVTNISKKFEK